MTRFTTVQFVGGFLLLVSGGLGYHTGAPDQACETMVPGHGPPPQTGKSPYRVLMDKTESSGEPLQITLTASSKGPPFKGFFIQIRQKGGDSPVGEFDPKSDSDQAQPVSCGGQQNVAMTHKSNDPKVQVTLMWTPPKGASGEYEPMVTFVQQQDTFWVKETPDKAIKVSGSSTSNGPSGEGNKSQEIGGRSQGGSEKDNGSSQTNESGQDQGAGASSVLPFFSGTLAIATSLLALKVFLTS